MKHRLRESPVLLASWNFFMTLQVQQLGIIPYHDAYGLQMELLEKVHREPQANDFCLVLQHPPVFTLGRNGSLNNVTVSKTFLAQKNIEVIRVERGGEITYHGPGQLICYPIINLRKRNLSIVAFIHVLEQIMLNVVAHFGIDAKRDAKNHGIWIADRKLGSVGIAVRHGISYHGLALNVNPDLEPFSWINPCGMPDVSVSSLEQELQQPLNIEEVEEVMVEEISKTFSDATNRFKKRHITKPKWLKQQLPTGPGYEKTRQLLQRNGLQTVCQQARCPNQFECFSKDTATFMLMGKNCTRNCGFCAVGHQKPAPLDHDEPARVALAVKDLGLRYTVLTSVSRDDINDGGAAHFVRTIKKIRQECPKTLIEVLIPDFQGCQSALALLCKHSPSVLNHNIETVPRLYQLVRPQAIYERSLELLTRVKELNPNIVTKSGLMLGLGETTEELAATMADIRKTGCNLLTLGQYLQPTANHLDVVRYVSPVEFERIREIALDFGFAGVTAGPHVRSSFNAGELYKLAA